MKKFWLSMLALLLMLVVIFYTSWIQNAFCRWGLSDSCLLQGTRYLEQGRDERAQELLEVGCSQHAPASCMVLANVLADNGHLRRAIELYEKSCQNGEMRACTNLGKLHLDARHPQADAARAYQLYQRACEGGEALSCYRLSLAVQEGKIAAGQLPYSAKELYERACKLSRYSATFSCIKPQKQS